MSIPPFLFLLLLLLAFFTPSHSRLTSHYYSKSCPRFEQIVQQVVTDKQITSPTTAAATLRLFFHDCLVTGCDGSLLVTSTPFNRAERDADLNLSLPGDAFDLVVRIKYALELACPGVVSCSDILALASRDLITMVGGPFYTVVFGRKDSLSSKASSIGPLSLPRPTMPISQLIQIFQSHGFSVRDMVALTGAHTIGFSHCKEFAGGIYNYSRSKPSDPSINPRFAQGLRSACKDYSQNPTISVFNDIMTPNKFDNSYYKNIVRGLGLLASDRALYADGRTREIVDEFAKDQNAFFTAFAGAMQKLSLLGVKAGRNGEIRHRCDAFNN